jgi:hypothetical protein
MMKSKRKTTFHIAPAMPFDGAIGLSGNSVANRDHSMLVGSAANAMFHLLSQSVGLSAKISRANAVVRFSG